MPFLAFLGVALAGTVEWPIEPAILLAVSLLVATVVIAAVLVWAWDRRAARSPR